MFEKLSEYLDRELDDVTCRDIEQHIAQCPPCKVCLETLKKTVALCHSLKEKPVPTDLSDRLKGLIREMSAAPDKP